MEVDLVNYENLSGGYPDTHPTGTMEHWNSDELTSTEGVETSFAKADDIMKNDLPYHCAFNKKATMAISPRYTDIYASPTDTYISPQNASPESLSSHPDLGKREEFVSSDIPVDDEFTVRPPSSTHVSFALVLLTLCDLFPFCLSFHTKIFLV
ncbi:hypothetical protein TRV_00531 [Trichophyton verrucosum HKI 0517]|uniref:Uncharacterized protein n=1 Tax=Trichophyton verrucosum (strain HKI 0517) TaxID=663202 RepID=D4D0D6_TRIVH|nr:uncharacterized protein TRV_00531 [Trichophyton verrucosum HKI 0517]EFE44681.1 hypothetical protein TRV_00531 [Trichophyton verrucosum HKI 0517]